MKRGGDVCLVVELDAGDGASELENEGDEAASRFPVLFGEGEESMLVPNGASFRFFCDEAVAEVQVRLSHARVEA